MFVVVLVQITGNASDMLSKEGLITVVASVAAYFLVHDYPQAARFLTPKEREYVIARLREDSDATREEKFSWGGVTQALKDPKIWLYGLCFHTTNLPLYTLTLFLPTIINELGYTAAQAQLLSTPPYIAAFFVTMASAVLAERTGRRAPFVIASSSLAIIGYILLITDHQPRVSYAGTIIAASGVYSATAVILSWPLNNVSGQTKRATASAMQVSIGSFGAIIGTQLYRPKWSPRFFVGHGVVRAYSPPILFTRAAR